MRRIILLFTCFRRNRYREVESVGFFCEFILNKTQFKCILIASSQFQYILTAPSVGGKVAHRAVNGLLPTNFLDLDICEIHFVIYLIQKYIKLCLER